VAHAWTEPPTHRAGNEEIGNLQLATIPPRVHSFNHLAWLSNDLAGLSNDLAGLSNDLARLSKGLARLSNDLAWLSNDLAWLSNDSINGVFDEKTPRTWRLCASAVQ
jgi:hypothetical protein